MKKPPANVDCAAVGIDPDSIKEETVLYDGPTRGICPKARPTRHPPPVARPRGPDVPADRRSLRPQFPRNVNTHASIAYAGIGFDRTQSLLVVNPEWEEAIVEIHAKGPVRSPPCPTTRPSPSPRRRNMLGGKHARRSLLIES